MSNIFDPLLANLTQSPGILRGFAQPAARTISGPAQNVAGLFSAILEQDLRGQEVSDVQKESANATINANIAQLQKTAQTLLSHGDIDNSTYSYMAFALEADRLNHPVFSHSPMANLYNNPNISTNRQWYWEFTQQLTYLVENGGDESDIVGTRNVVKQLEKQHVERMILDSLGQGRSHDR